MIHFEASMGFSLVNLEKAHSIYPDGAVLITEPFDYYPGTFVVTAEAKYDPKVTKDKALCDYHRQYPKTKEDPTEQEKMAVIIPPKSDTLNFFEDLSISMSFRDFILDPENTIKQIKHTYRSIFLKNPADNVAFITSISEDGETVTLYGITNDYSQIDAASLEEKMGNKVRFYTWTYYTMKKGLMKKQAQTEAQPLEGSGGVLVALDQWIQSTPFSEFHEAIAEQVIGQEELDKVTASVYLYIKALTDGKPTDINLLLTAPSGCGKTETYRALKRYFAHNVPQFPVLMTDTSNVTAAGYKGSDPVQILLPLANAQTDGIGLFFLDEFDKKIVPSYNTHGYDANEEVCNQFLAFLEGQVVKPEKCDHTVNTKNTMFIACGSFGSIRKTRSQDAASMGFGGKIKADLADTHYDPIKREDVIKLGASYELVGRFAALVNYHPLSENAIDLVVDSVITNISESMDCSILLTDEMRTYLHSQANGEFGCRAFRNEIFDSAMASYRKALMDGADLSAIRILLTGPSESHYINDPERQKKNSDSEEESELNLLDQLFSECELPKFLLGA